VTGSWKQINGMSALMKETLSTFSEKAPSMN
jgi:hypothetical protein